MLSVYLIIMLFQVLFFSNGFKLFEKLSLLKISYIIIILPSLFFSRKSWSLLSLTNFFSSCFFLSYYLPLSSFCFKFSEQNSYKSKFKPKSIAFVIFVLVAFVPLNSFAYFQKNRTIWTIKYGGNVLILLYLE